MDDDGLKGQSDGNTSHVPQVWVRQKIYNVPDRNIVLQRATNDKITYC